jgi:hypothetical protein
MHTVIEKTDQNDLTLVLGGTGKTGRRVAERLKALGVPTRVGSRSATPPFDWDDPGTWAAALQDVKAVYVTYAPDLAVPVCTGLGWISGGFGRVDRHWPGPIGWRWPITHNPGDSCLYFWRPVADYHH